MSIEFFCYLLAPLYFNTKPKHLFFLILFSAVCFGSYNLLGEPLGPIPFLKYGLPLILLTWAWLLGFFYFINLNSNWVKLLVVLLGSLLLLTYYYNNPPHGELSFLVYLFSCTTLLFSSKIFIPKKLGKAFNYLGDISYPLYLFHIPAFLIGYAYIKVHNSFILIGLALLLSIFAYHLLDVPLRIRKRKLT